VTVFQRTALLLTAIWLVMVGVRFRRSKPVLIGGLAALGFYTVLAFCRGAVMPNELGLGIPGSWWSTVAYASVWLGLMVVCSLLADRLANRWFAKPPTRETFRAIQESVLYSL
jgi:hypothetical protein